MANATGGTPATNTAQSVLKSAVEPLKAAGVSSLAIGVGVGITALAVQVAVVSGKALIANAKDIAASLR